MDTNIDIIQNLINEEIAQRDRLLEKIEPIRKQIEIINKTIEHYEEILSLKSDKGDQDSKRNGVQAIRRSRTTPIPPPQQEIRVEGSQADFVRELIDNEVGQDEEFSFRTIIKIANNKIPGIELSRNVLHNVFKQKKELKEIKVEKQGQGRAPTFYKKIKRPTQMTFNN